MQDWDDQRLEWVVKNRRRPRAVKPLAESVKKFLHRWVHTRQKRLAQLSQAWCEILPPELVEHSCLENFSRGQLRVLVDSASHLAELDMLVRETLLQQLQQMCPQLPLSRIKLVRGTWYRTNEEGQKIMRY